MSAPLGSGVARWLLALLVTAGGLCASCAGPEAPAAAPTSEPLPPLPTPIAPETELPPGVEAISLLGESFSAPPLPAEERAKFEAQLEAARVAHRARPGDVEALITYARRLGQVGRFRASVAVYSDGLRMHPDEARLYRFRGHRYITLRQFDLAVDDLTRAAQLVEGQPDQPEPSLEPNERGVDLDTLQENIWYHLALAHYLRGEWADALECWQRCAQVAPNDDGRAMAAYWSANAASRLGRDDEVAAAVSAVTADMDVLEYHAYHQLALMWKGERDGDELLAAARAAEGGADSVEFASLGYGVATWHRARGEMTQASAVLDEVLASPNWHAFGRVAAEADRARDGSAMTR